jgi:hypothetical protein
MKNLRIFALFSSISLGLLAVANKAALAAGTICRVNGEIVPCDQLGSQMSGYFGWMIFAFLLFIAFGIWSTVFWVMMIVHAATNDVENKAIWVVLMVFTGIVGAVAYYFAVKRKFKPQTASASPAAPAAPSAPPAAPTPTV